MPYQITDACTKCRVCLPECPTGSILEGPRKFLIDADSCAEHASCVAVCPEDAIKLIGQSTASPPSHSQ